MAFLLAAWAVLILCGAVIGGGLRQASGVPDLRRPDRLILEIWLGLLAFGTVLLGVSLVMPLSPWMGGAAAVAMVAAGWRFRSPWPSLPVRTWMWLGALACACAFSASGAVQAYDTGLYHYQLTRWLAEFGTVPGLALLNPRFGQSSSWFALAAPFDAGPFRARLGGLTGGLAIFLSVVHLAIALWRIIRREASRADWFLAGGYPLIIAASAAWSFQISLSPDVPVWIATLLAGWVMVLGGSPVLLAALAFSLKLSSLPLLALALAMRARVGWRMLAIAAFPVVIVLAANGMASGFPLFPYTSISLPVAWNPGEHAATMYADEIAKYARTGSGAGDSIPNWVVQPDKLAVWGLEALCLAGVAFLRGWRLSNGYRWAFRLAIAGSLFVLITLPNPRFAIGYCALLPAALATAWSESAGPLQIRPPSWRVWPPLAVVPVALTLAAAIYFGRLTLPLPLPRVDQDVMIVKNRHRDVVTRLHLVREESNGLSYWRPAGGDQCWGANLPCVPSTLNSAVELRDARSGLRGGFIPAGRPVPETHLSTSRGMSKPGS